MRSKALWVSLSFIVLITAAHAGFRLPSSVFEISELDQALEKSRSRGGVPVTFLISNTETTCGLCIAASQDMINELRTSTVVVYARNIGELPPSAQNAVRGTDTGRFIPYSLVLNPGLDRLLGIIKYEDWKSDSRRAFRDLKRTVREAQAGS